MTKRNYLSLVTAALLLLFVAAEATADGGAKRRVPVSQRVNVRFGREVAVPAYGLKIRFVAVPEDSRCPKDVQCVWAGNGRVALRVSRAKSKAARVELNTNGAPREIVYANYTIKLTDLSPYPASSQTPLAQSDYVATLEVSPKKPPAR